jgi:hypothetical protein
MLLAGCVDQELGTENEAEVIWGWDGSTWSLVADDGPPPTVVTSWAWDRVRSVVVRYGGLPMDSNDCVPETWEWDLESWDRIEAEPPTVCDHAFMTWEDATQNVLLTGGGDDEGTLYTETWSWDGRHWQLLTDEGPAGRAHFGLTYDSTHNQALLYGGYDGTQVFDDFWSWQDGAWDEVQLDGPSPGPRSHVAIAADPLGLLLFGGSTSPSTFSGLTDETWYLTDGRWRLLDGPGPSPRGSPALGYDETREVFVLYGGFGADGGQLSDTWEWDGAWRCVAGC